MTAAAYSASWWPILGLLAAVLILFALALVTGAKEDREIRGPWVRPEVVTEAARRTDPTRSRAVSVRAAGTNVHTRALSGPRGSAPLPAVRRTRQLPPFPASRGRNDAA